MKNDSKICSECGGRSSAARLGGCDTMSTRDKDTAIGAGIGAVGVPCLRAQRGRNGGGAAVGGLIGNQVAKASKCRQ